MIQINNPIFNKTSFSGQTPEKTKTPVAIQKQLLKDEFVSKEDKQEKKKKKAWLEGILTATIIIGGLAAITAWILLSNQKATQEAKTTFTAQGSSKFKDKDPKDIEKIKKEKEKIIDMPKNGKGTIIDSPKQKLQDAKNQLKNLEDALEQAKKAQNDATTALNKAEKNWTAKVYRESTGTSTKPKQKTEKVKFAAKDYQTAKNAVDSAKLSGTTGDKKLGEIIWQKITPSDFVGPSPTYTLLGSRTDDTYKNVYNSFVTLNNAHADVAKSDSRVADLNRQIDDLKAYVTALKAEAFKN